MDPSHRTENAGPAVPASAIMPTLPDPLLSEPRPEHRTADRLILLLASAAQEGGRLSPSAWHRASEALAALFAPQAMPAGMPDDARRQAEHDFVLLQARFHAALLREPLAPERFAADRNLGGDLAALSPDKADLLLDALQDMAPPYAEALRLARPAKSATRAQAGEGAKAASRSAGWESLLGSGEAPGEDSRNTVMENGVAVPRPQPRGIVPPALRRQFDALGSLMTSAGSACGDMTESVAHAAASQYQGAARYLRELGIQRMFGLFRREESAGVVTPALEGAERSAAALERSALESGCLDTARALGDLRHLMLEQPFTLVLVGEGKRGKSSLVNALLGRALSPVRESVPETAAVARFRWGSSFRGRVTFLDEQLCGELAPLLRSHADDPAFGERVRRLLDERPPQTDRELRGEDELRAFLSADGGDSLFSARAEVELPADMLRHGLVLVDTPGLNATDPMQNLLAFEECLGADCLLFVMDARRPESASERELLRQLARSGRAASLIGVVTGMDRLNEVSSRNAAMERARMLMDAVQAEGLRVMGLAAVNARQAMEQRVAGREGGEDFRELCGLIGRAASQRQESRREERLERVRTKGMALTQAARSDAERFLAAELARLPDPRHEELLRRHVERLESVMESCSSQAWSLAGAASVDMEAWRKEQTRALDGWQERTALRLVDAANKHADSLGFTGMFKPKNWKDFDEREVPRIARECLEELLAERRDVQRDWNEKLHQFGQRLQELSVLCLDAVVNSESELQSISDVPFSRERWLVNANSVMKKVGLVAMGLAIRRGGGLGLGIVLGNMGWWALLPVAVVGSVVWTLMKLGSPSRCRRLLMERKEESIRRWTAEQRKRLDELLEQNLDDIARAYGKAVSEGFMPALSVLSEETAAMRAYLAVMERMRGDTARQAGIFVERARELERRLALLDG